MAKYTISAIITKINSDGTIMLKGVGKHRYEKTKDECLNFLESDDDVCKSKVLGLNKPIDFKIKNEVLRTVLAMAMFNKKPLKLTIEENVVTSNMSKKFTKDGSKKESKYSYAIIAVEVP